MKFTVDKKDRYVVIEPLSNNLDGDKAAKLKGEFMLRSTAGQRNIVLNLGHITKIDESGVRMGLLAHRLCRTANGLFILVDVQPEVLKYLSISRLDNYFLIVDNTKEAAKLIINHEEESDISKNK